MTERQKKRGKKKNDKKKKQILYVNVCDFNANMWRIIYYKLKKIIVDNSYYIFK